MQTYLDGPRGVVPAIGGDGKYMLVSHHRIEVAEWERANNDNRKLAEDLLRQQDGEIAAKNITIQRLEDRITELEN